MAELQHHPSLPTTQQVRRYLLENEEAYRSLGLDGQPFQIRFLGRGAANAAYGIRTQGHSDRVLRVALQAANRENLVSQVACEAAVLEFLTGREVSPSLEWVDLDGGTLGHPLLVMGYLPGRSIDYRISDLKAAARLYARLHNTPGLPPLEVPRVPDPVTRYVEEAQVWLQRYQSWAGADSGTVQELESALYRVASQKVALGPSVLIHGDGTWGNWRIGRGEARILDWDWCRVTTPAADLGHFLSPSTTSRWQGRLLSREEEQLVIDEYCAHRSSVQQDEFEEQFRRFRSVVVFHSTTWTAAYLVQLAEAEKVSIPNSKPQEEPEFLRVLKKGGIERQLIPEFLRLMKKEGIW